MKIYFAKAITGYPNNRRDLFEFIKYFKKYGEVTDEAADWNGEDIHLTAEEIHDRDLKWLQDADVLIAEVTNKSLGVGYEIGRATELKKKILCLCRLQKDKRISPIIEGSRELVFKEYNNLDEAFRFIDDFLKEE